MLEHPSPLRPDFGSGASELLKGWALGLIWLSLSGCSGAQAPVARTEPVHRVTWPVDNLEKIGVYDVSASGEPRVAEGLSGKAVCFDGVDQGLAIGVNPFDKQYEFTIQVLLKPTKGGGALQQLLHLENEDELGRIILERRLVGEDRWTPRAFLRSGDLRADLELPSEYRPVDDWYWLQLTFSEEVVRLYLNGELLVSENMAFAPMTEGSTAIGMKNTGENFFSGCIQEIRMATAGLRADELEQRPVKR